MSVVRVRLDLTVDVKLPDDVLLTIVDDDALTKSAREMAVEAALEALPDSVTVGLGESKTANVQFHADDSDVQEVWLE